MPHDDNANRVKPAIHREDAVAYIEAVLEDGDPGVMAGALETLRIWLNRANAEDLRAAIAEADAGRLEQHDLIKE